MSSPEAGNSTADTLAIAQGGAQNALIGGLATLGLYGVYFVLFCITIHILCFRRKRQPTNRFLLMAALALFIFASMDVLIECHRLLIGLLYTPGPEIDAYFNSGGDWSFGLQDTVRVLNMLIGDAVLVYRAWMVWEKRWPVVAFNILVWLATLVTSIRIVQLQILWIQQPEEVQYLLDMVTWSLATQCLTLAQTTTATGLIVFRLWRVDRAASQYKDTSLLPVVRILVESGVLYTSLMLVNVVVTSLVNPGLFIILQVTSPIIGITFSLIIVRVGLGLSLDTTQGSTMRSTMASSQPPRSINISVRRHINSERAGDDDENSAFEDGLESVTMKAIGRKAEDV